MPTVIPAGKPVYTTGSNVNARYVLDKTGKRNNLGSVVGNVIGSYSGFVGISTGLTSGNYLKIAYFHTTQKDDGTGTKVVTYGTDQYFWMSLDYLTTSGPVSADVTFQTGIFAGQTFQTADGTTQQTAKAPTVSTDQGKQNKYDFGSNGAKGEYGIPAPFGYGFNIPDWMKGIPGLLLLAGTVYVATRKQKN